jgi:hypothetical protein
MKKTFAALVLGMTMATAAHAQPGDRVALGAGIGFNTYRDGAFSSKNPSVVPEYNLGFVPHTNRRGLSLGLMGGVGYLSVDRSGFIGDFETRSGNLRMFTAMVGAGPSYRAGPLSIGVGVVAGPSFNNFSVDNGARAAYRDRLGATLNSIKVEDSFAAEPNLNAWYNLTPRLGLHGAVGYTINRPMVRTTVDGVTSSTRWTTDGWSYDAGLALGIF